MANILIADDDADLRLNLSFNLKAAGHEVAVCQDGEGVLKMLMARRPDLLILDIMMPQMDGFEVLDLMDKAGLRRQTKVLILTAKSGERDREKALALRADRFMTKPYDVDELAMTVTEMLALSEYELQAERDLEHRRARLLAQLDDTLGDEEPS